MKRAGRALATYLAKVEAGRVALMIVSYLGTIGYLLTPLLMVGAMVGAWLLVRGRASAD